MIKVKEKLKLEDIRKFINENFGEGYNDGNGGIKVKCGYISICNSNEIYLENRRDIAQKLSDDFRHCGKELIINFYPY